MSIKKNIFSAFKNYFVLKSTTTSICTVFIGKHTKVHFTYLIWSCLNYLVFGQIFRDSLYDHLFEPRVSYAFMHCFSSQISCLSCQIFLTNRKHYGLCGITCILTHFRLQTALIETIHFFPRVTFFTFQIFVLVMKVLMLYVPCETNVCPFQIVYVLCSDAYNFV